MARKHLPLLLIILLAAFLRLVALGSVPSGFTSDEASQGYSAYSLLRTGRDEWGTLFPITSFRSFLDYKAPLQTYLMIPFVAIFGLNQFSVRLPSAIIGILAVLTVYFLANELFGKRQLKIDKLELDIGHLAALFLALSPWHLQFSRTALEINITSLLFPLGLLLFLKGLTNNKFLYLAVLAWGVNLYSYHAAKLFEPVFIGCLLFLNRRALLKLPRLTIVKLSLLGFLFVAPVIFSSLFGSGAARANDLLITTIGKEGIAQINLIQFNSPLKSLASSLPRVFTNKATYILDQFSRNFISYLSPAFWFTEGGREITYSVLPGTGLLYLFLFPLIAYGFYRLIAKKNPHLPLFCLWFVAAVLPAALTKEGYRPNRTGSLLVFWEIIAAFGLIELFSVKFFRRRLLPFALVAAVFVVFYLNTYFFEYPYRFPTALSYGYRDLVTVLSAYPDDQTIVVDRGNNSQTFVAFYRQINPATFQQFAKQWWSDVERTRPAYLDQLEEYRLGNYVFKNFNPGVDLVPGKVIAIPAHKYMDPYQSIVKNIIRYPDDVPAFYILYIPGKE